MSSTSLTETRDPPPILYTRPGTPRVAAAMVALNSVLHKGEVAGLLAVAKDGNRLAQQSCLKEFVKAHVGALPRAVDGEVAQRHCRHAVVREVQVAQLFRRELADPIRRHGLRQRVFAHRHRDIVAVHRRARRVHQPFERPADARLQQHLRGLDVVHGVDREIASPAFSDAGLRGQMKHVRAIGEKRRQIGVLNRRFDEAEARMAQQRREIPLLQCPRVVIGKTVDAEDIRASTRAAALRASIR